MSLLQRKTLSIVLIVVVFWLGYRAMQIHAERESVKQQVSELQSRVEEGRRNNQFLASSSAYFGSDSYLERQARLKLNYKQSDEQVAFVYPDANAKKTSAEETLRVQIKQMPSWKKWWYYVLGYQD